MMIRTQIQLTDVQIRALRDFASREKRSVADIIRELVDRHIERIGRPDPDEVRRRALSASGRFHSGVRDLSTHHDRHLSEAFES